MTFLESLNTLQAVDPEQAHKIARDANRGFLTADEARDIVTRCLASRREMSSVMRECYGVTLGILDAFEQLAPHAAKGRRSSLNWYVSEYRAGRMEEGSVWFALGYTQAEVSADIQALS